MEKIKLSVVIVNYNTKDLLKQCLRSVNVSMGNMRGLRDLRNTSETIVVDNASSDGSVEMIKKEFSWTNIIANKENIGFSGGCNIGLAKTKGEYILFLNSDTKVFPMSFKKITEFMDKNPMVGASTAKTMLFSGGMDPDCHRGFPTPWASICYFLGIENLFPKSEIFGQYHKFYLDLNKDHEIDAGFGTFMCVRKIALEKVGKWDESYFFYGEDLDLFYRIKKAGWKIMFYHEPLLLHHKGASSGLRHESKNVATVDKKTRNKVAKASIKAMEIFYKKFYKEKYSPVITWMIILGIKMKGFFRILYHYLK